MPKASAAPKNSILPGAAWCKTALFGAEMHLKKLGKVYPSDFLGGRSKKMQRVACVWRLSFFFLDGKMKSTLRTSWHSAVFLRPFGQARLGNWS